MVKIKKGDLVIGLILVCSLLAGFGLRNFWLNDSENKQVVIQVEGKIYEKLSLEAGNEPRKVDITLPEGKFIRVSLEKGLVYVAEGDVNCPDKVCVKTGKISRVGQSIVCLPNKVAVYIEGSEKAAVDEVAY